MTPAFEHSPELSLAWRLFRQELPDDVRVVRVIQDEEELEPALRETIATQLHGDGLSKYVLVARVPWMFLGPGTVATLCELLDANPEVDCVLPSDLRGYRQGAPPVNYLTKRGFERFVASLQDPARPMADYDGRDPALYVVRASALRALSLPDSMFQLPALIGDKARVALNAYVHIPVNYYGTNREEIIPLIPGEVHSLLDIGCSRGGFGAAVKAERHCRVVGIELNAYEAQRARRNLDHVEVGDALQVRLGERFDCVTCLDSLEHFTDPNALLRRIHDDFLRPGGYLVVSIPNVAHWSLVEDVLAGRWDYVPTGLLCPTHYRFYTFSTIRNLLHEEGYEIIKSTSFDVPLSASMSTAIAALEQSGIEVDRSGLEVVNYHIVARRRDVHA